MADETNQPDPTSDEGQAPAAPAAGDPPPADGADNNEPTVIDGHEIPADLSTVEDADLRDFYQSLLDGQKEDKEGAGTAAADQQQASQPPAEGAQPSQTQQPSQPPQTVPVAALQDERTKRTAAEQSAAYWKGVAEARGGGQPQTQQPGADAKPTAQPDPANDLSSKIAAVQTDIEALAEKFDNGEISMKDFKKGESALLQKQQDLRDEALAAKIEGTRKAPDTESQDLYLDVLTSQIEEKHPNVHLVFPEKLPADAGERSLILQRQDFIKAEARAELAREQPGLQPGARADLAWREKLAQVTDRYVPVWFPGQQQTKPPANTKPNGQAPLTPRQQERLEKLNTAGQQPPDTQSLGTADGGGMALTPEQAAKLSDDEYARLPEATRARLRGE